MKILNDLINFIKYKEDKVYDFVLPDASASQDSQIADKANELKPLENVSENVYPSIDVNLEYVKVKYNTLINSDIKVREFFIRVREKQYKAFLLYIDGMINSSAINQFVVEPLMLNGSKSTSSQDIISTAVTNNVTVRRVKKFNLIDYISECLIPQNDVTTVTKFKEIFPQVNSGVSALFVDTISTVFLIDAKGFDKRSVTNPENETIIRGSQEGFIEAIRTNTSLLRRIVNNEDLIIEDLSVGTISATKVAVCYLKNVANDDLVAEIKYRINNLKVDYITSSGQLEQLIEDTSYSIPQLIATERPDRVASNILEGRVAILVNGTPYALIAPAVFIDFLTSQEDRNIKYQYANLLKGIRLIALFLTLLLPRTLCCSNNISPRISTNWTAICNCGI